MRLKSLVAAALLFATSGFAIDLDISSSDSIISAAKTVASSIFDRYNNGSEIIGLFGQPYYFWESGLTWDSLITYWYKTGDDTYNEVVAEALRFQLSPDNNFMSANQTKTLGNDDQAFWALAAMTAAEYSFPIPPIEGQNTSWADIAANVFDNQVARWNNDTCGGGLRWQIFTFNNGYNYKNSLTNGNFFQLAARLGLYTGNSTYSLWAREVFEWSFNVGLIQSAYGGSDTILNATANPDTGAVWDGTDTNTNCSQFNRIEWTANIGTYASGEAYAYNESATTLYSGSLSTISRVNISFASLPSAAGNGTLTETACAANNNCNVDQLAFRAVLARGLADIRALVPVAGRTFSCAGTGIDPLNVTASRSCPAAWTSNDRIDFILQTSAKGAAAQCSGGAKGTTCGSAWGNSTWDGTEGLGQDLSALNIFLANLPQGRLAKGSANGTTTPAANGTIGNSTGTAGGAASNTSGDQPITSSNSASGLPASTFALLAGFGLVIAFCI